MGTSPFDLHGRVALVTGGSRGLGLGMARGLAAAGARVVINGLSEDNLARAKSALRQEGLSVESQAFDATDGQAILDGVAAVERDVGPIDILINNAGLNRRAPILELSDENWNHVLNADLTGPFRLARAVAPGMIARKWGKIINVASIASFLARAGIPAYMAAKGGLAVLTKAMAVEWAQHNVQANAIAPGYFKTDLTAPFRQNDEMNTWIVTKTPAKRWGLPEELAGIAVYLSSDASNFVNGQTIVVDGGFMAAL